MIDRLCFPLLHFDDANVDVACRLTLLSSISLDFVVNLVQFVYRILL